MSIGRNSIYNIFGSVVPLILALVTIPLYLNAVGTERYGALAVAWLILGYFGLFDLGLGRATSQRIAALINSSAEHRARVFWTAVLVNMGMGIVGGAILYFCAIYFFTHKFNAENWLRSEILEAIPYLSLAVPIATLTGVANGALQGREKFLDVNIITIIGTCLFQLLPLIIAYLCGPVLKWLIMAAILARIIGFLIFYVRVHHHILEGFKPSFDNKEWLSLLKFGGWVSLSSIIGPLMVIADRFMIGALITAAAVTIYVIPFDIVQRISVLPRALTASLFPKMSMLDSDQSIALSDRSVRIINIFISPIILGLIYLIAPLLSLWIGAEIATKAGSIALILLLGWWVNSFAIIPYSRLQAEGRPDLVAKTHLIELPFYTVSLYYALSEFGLLGAAAAFSTRTAIDYIVLNKLSSGRWHIPRDLIVISIILFTSIIFNSHFSAFTIYWYISFLISVSLLFIILLKNIPMELKKYADKYIATNIVNRLNFNDK